MQSFILDSWEEWDNLYISVNGEKVYRSYVGLANVEEAKKEEKKVKEFKVGDTVQCSERDLFNLYPSGRKYTVAKIITNELFWLADTVTGEQVSANSCNFEKVDKPEEKVKGKKILIMQDEGNPRKVIAKDLGTGEIGEAVCAPADDFDFYTGAKLALSRLEKESLISWTGKVVCVESGDHRFTVGKVYSVNDGYIVSDTGIPATSHRFTDVNDLNSFFVRVQFIEFKGEA